jgi:hypothetical protein
MEGNFRKLRTGVAYHGNRMLKHVHEDMADIIQHNFNLVVHMFSHTDWDRHRSIMKEIIAITEGLGLDVWVDNWGIGGPPGDKSHFLAYYPDSHQIDSNGVMDPVRACLNSPDFRKFTKEWIDAVHDIGGKSIFWDEPHLAGRDVVDGKPSVWTCMCPKCAGLFEQRYDKPMPKAFTSEVEQFRVWTVVDYFDEMTRYSKKKEMENIVCVMLGDTHGISLATIDEISRLECLDNVGSDPYFFDEGLVGDKDKILYDFVHKATRKNLEISEKYHKDHNVWVQGFGLPKGHEEEIVIASDAAYDAGARTILVWGFRGSESNDYRMANPELAWKTIGDAMHRITERERDSRRDRLRGSCK